MTSSRSTYKPSLTIQVRSITDNPCPTGRLVPFGRQVTFINAFYCHFLCSIGNPKNDKEKVFISFFDKFYLRFGTFRDIIKLFQEGRKGESKKERLLFQNRQPRVFNPPQQVHVQKV